MKFWDRAHEPVFGQTTVHYIFTWAATGQIDVRKIANRLLVGGIAESVGSPASSEVRVSPGLASLGKHLHRLERAKEVRNFRNRRDAAKWILRNPKLAIEIHNSARKIRDNPRDRQPAEFRDKISELEAGIKEIVWKAQEINAIQHAVETDLYAPAYLEDEPYLRLTLHGFACWLDISDAGVPRQPGDLSGGIAAEVLLLIHRSGCIQLTMVIQLPDSLSTGSLTRSTMANKLRVARSEISETIMRASSKYLNVDEKEWSGDWAEGMAQGTRWRQVNHEPTVPLVQFFEMYRDAIEQVARINSIGQWRAYPVVFVDSLGCCSSERQWMKNHKDDLTSLIARTPHRTLRRSLLPENQALTTQTSVYCDVGSTTYIRWRFSPGRSDYSEQLLTVVLIEHVLLRYWQLVALAHRLTSIQTNPQSATRVQHEAIFGLQEYRRTVLVFGSAAEMANQLMSRLGENEMYTRILESLGTLQQMIAVEISKRSARSQNIVAAATILATVVLGLPSVAVILSTAKVVPPAGFVGRIVSPFQALARRGALGIWESYLVLLAIVIAIVVISLIRRRRWRARRSAPPGFDWPHGGIRIVRDEQ